MKDISTREIAKRYKIDHSVVIDAVGNNIIDLENFERSSPIVFTAYNNKTTTSYECLMTQKQAMFLVLLIKNKKETIEFKKRLVNAVSKTHFPSTIL